MKNLILTLFDEDMKSIDLVSGTSDNLENPTRSILINFLPQDLTPEFKLGSRYLLFDVYQSLLKLAESTKRKNYHLSLKVREIH
ncbi:MAG: hypothetical protein AABX16_03700 [Nanoarchaeota archaeon]